MPARLTRGPVPGRRNSGTNSPDPRYRQALSATWEQAARLLDYGFALDTSSSVGDLVEPDSTSPVTSTRATSAVPTLAQPPASASSAESGSRQSDLQAQGDTVVRIAIGVIGALVVAGLLWGARTLSRRP